MPKTKTTVKKTAKPAAKKKIAAPKKVSVKKTSKKITTEDLDDIGLAKLCASLVKDKKASNVKVLDLRKLTAPCSFFVLCCGESSPQLRAIASHLEKELKAQHQIKPYAYDGNVSSYWLALDYGSVIVHIMDPEKYDYYKLDKLWADAAPVK